MYRQWEPDSEKAPQPPVGYRRMVEYLKARSRFEIAMHEAGFLFRFRSFLCAMTYRGNWRRCVLVYPWYAIWGIGDLWVKHASFGNGWHELLAQGANSKD